MRAWGSSFDGQLGNGTNTDALTPVTVAGLTDTLSIAACNSVSFALAGLTGTSVVATHAKGQPGQSLSIEAQLLASGTPLAGRSLDVTIDGSPAGTYVTDANGRVSLSYTILESDAYDAKYVLFSFAGDMLLPRSSGAGAFIGTPGQTTTWTVDRTGVMTDLTYLRAWLRRVWDGTYLAGRSIQFRIDGVIVGSEVTDANGRATLPWIITDGPTTRVIEARFQGDAAYQMSSGAATLTAQTIETKTHALDRTQRIARSVLLRGYLRRKVASTPIEGKSLEFSVDGTSVGKVLTGPTGRADQRYVVPEGSGAGVRPILVEWAGDAGYLPSSYTADLNVQRATVYIWPLVKSVAQGTPATLKAYLRRMPDYVALSDKDLSFSIDGTHVGTATTANFPLSSYGWATLYGVDTSGLAIGVHSGSVSFAGDAFYEPGSSPFSINIL